jgi:HK97 family phage portal protein
VYLYRVDNDVMALAADSVLHVKGMGNGTLGLSRLDYMRATTNECANALTAASKLFSSGGKPTGVLMVDNVLSAEQRAAIRNNFSEMQSGNASRLFVLEANMKYQQLSLSPEDMQLLETRQFGVEEVCRWFGVPPVLVGHSNVTTWGSGVEQIIEGFYKFTCRPIMVGIEQAIAKRVLTPAQRARYTVEFNFEGLLRVNLKDRAEVYSKLLQNGVFTRNEARQLENMPPIPGGDKITVQSNLVELQNLPNPGAAHAA